MSASQALTQQSRRLSWWNFQRRLISWSTLRQPMRVFMSSSPPIRARRDHRAVFLTSIGISLALSFCATNPSPAQTPAPRDLTQLDLADLMNIQVTSVSKREQRVSSAGAAIFVISQEDIRRSG